MEPEEIARNRERVSEEIRQRQELLKAYDLVAEDLKRNGSTPITGTPITARHRSRSASMGGYGEITHAVKAAILHTDKSFIIRDLYDYLRINGMDVSIASVTTVVNRMKSGKSPTIRVKHQGSGRRPTIYERI